jgi:hypothetical protein
LFVVAIAIVVVPIVVFSGFLLRFGGANSATLADGPSDPGSSAAATDVITIDYVEWSQEQIADAQRSAVDGLEESLREGELTDQDLAGFRAMGFGDTWEEVIDSLRDPSLLPKEP